MSKKLGKYVAAFDYIDKTLIVFSATRGGINIIFMTSVIEIPAGLASANFTFVFSLTTGIIKKLLKITRKKEKKHNISHEEFKAIAIEKEKCEQMNENIRNTKRRDELSENNKENSGNAKNYFFFFVLYI